MFRGFSIRILLCSILAFAAIAGGFLNAPGIRHRHDDGDVAHSHSAHSHSHPHVHGHSHHHSHAHREHEGSRDDSTEAASVVEEPASHMHFYILGFELTLPDFFSEEPAPLVAVDSVRGQGTSPAGDVIRLPSPFSLAELIHVTLRWTAIGCSGIQLEGTDHPFGRTVVASDINRGLDPSAPPLPPPQAL